MEIKIKYHDGEMVKLEKITQGDWIDLRSRVNVDGRVGTFVLIPLGVSMKLPVGYEAHLVPRSSSFKKYGFIQTNGVGIIDESYCGNDDEWMLPAYFLRTGEIKKGERIAQFRIVKKQPDVYFTEVTDMPDKNRGGFGSTGNN